MGRSKDREVHGSGPESVLDKAKHAVGLGHTHTTHTTGTTGTHGTHGTHTHNTNF